MLVGASISADAKWMSIIYGTLGGLIALLVFVGIVYLVHLPLSLLRQRNEARKEIIELRPASPLLVPQTLNLVNGTITVSAGKHYDVSFTIDASRMQNAVVSGSFAVSGGSGNDVIAFIMDDVAYTNWGHGHSVNVLYNSGQVTTGVINVPIATSGQYYLIYSNTFSTFSSKQVSTKVDLKWSELQNH